MQIDRIEDKRFMITITEEEALRLSDGTDFTLTDCKTMSLHLGRLMLYYMIDCSESPHAKRPVLEVEL